MDWTTRKAGQLRKQGIFEACRHSSGKEGLEVDSCAALRCGGGANNGPLDFVARGPNRPLIARPVAALQLPKNGHSSIAQHFYRSDDGSVDFAGPLFLLWHKSGCAFLTGRIKPHLCSVNGGVRTGQLAEQMSAT
jgi:hypothetical protein